MSKRFVAAIVIATVALPTAALAARLTLHPVASAKLTAAAVPNGAPGAAATIKLQLKVSDGKACWKIGVRKIGTALSTHVHYGKPGHIGRVVLPLGARFSKQGCVKAPKKWIRDVSRSPGSYYVDIHTKKYLNGAVRGQLRAN